MLILGNEPVRGKGPFVDYVKMREIAKSALSQLGENISPDATVGTLSVAQTISTLT